MNRMYRIFLVALSLVSFTAGNAWAHGVGFRFSERAPISLEFFYSTGETMAYMETKVYAPTDDRIEFQSGRTDASGRFAFTPDRDGPWRIVVRDGEGHRVEAAIPVAPLSSDLPSDPKIQTSGGGSLPEGTALAIRAALGVSLLFNIASVVLLRRARR